jgi:ubiquinone biosynthesis protein COQ9
MTPETPTTPSDRFRARLLAALPAQVGTFGWSDAALRAAALEAGLSEGERMLAAPDGVIDMIDAFLDRADRDMMEGLAAQDVARLKIRERVTLAVRLRIEAQLPFKAAVAKLPVGLMLHGGAHQGPKFVWRTADRIWRALGDSSTDANFYSKRAILSGVLASTYARWLADDSPGHEATWAFLDDRIANVMQIEKVKARLKPLGGLGETITRFAARARYGGGQP